jgi:DNA polymerase-3 subunit epsilon
VPDELSPPPPPPRSLRRADWRRAPFAALDFETTGLDYERDAVVSFGVVPVRGGRVIVGEAAHELVATGVRSTPVSMKIHQILPQDLAEALPLAVAAERLRSELQGRFLLTWYADVELAFLRRLFGGGRRAWVRRTVDVRRLVLRLEHADPRARFGLSATAERYGVPVANPHEALDDALVTAQLFLVLASRLEGRRFGSVRSFLRLTDLDRRG